MNSSGDPYFNIRSQWNYPNQTLGDFLIRHHLKQGDIIDELFFVDGTSNSYNFLGRFRIEISKAYAPSVVITSRNFKQIFKISANVSYNAFYSDEAGNFLIEWSSSLANHHKFVTGYCTKVSRFDGTQWRFNNTHLAPSNAVLQGLVDWQTPMRYSRNGKIDI